MGYHDNDGILECSLCVRKGYARAKKHRFCLAEISRVQGSGKRVMLKALVAVTTADSRTCGVLSCYLGHVFDASWLYVPDGCSYLGSWCFTYYMVLISPCGLMDISYWLISLVFHVKEEC